MTFYFIQLLSILQYPTNIIKAVSLPSRTLNGSSKLHLQVSLASVEVIKVEGRVGVEACIQLLGRSAAGQVAWPLGWWRPSNIGHLTYFFDFHRVLFFVPFSYLKKKCIISSSVIWIKVINTMHKNAIHHNRNWNEKSGHIAKVSSSMHIIVEGKLPMVPLDMHFFYLQWSVLSTSISLL